MKYFSTAPERENYTMDIARSSIRVFGVKATNAGVGFLAITYFAQELGSEQLGTFFLFQAILSVLIISTDLGIRGAVEKRISEGRQPDQIFGTALLLKTPLWIVTGLAVVFFETRINAYIGAPLADLLLIALFVRDLSELLTFTIRGELRVGETATLDLSRQLSWVIVSVTLVSLGFGVEGIVYGLLAGLAVMTIWAGYKLSTGIGMPSFADAKSLFRYARYAIVLILGWQIHNWFDTLIIGWYLGQGPVGLYEVAWRVAGISLLLTKAISLSVFPKVSSLDIETQAEEIGSLLQNVITPSVFFIIPALLGAWLFSDPIMRLLFGAEYVAASFTLVLLIFGMILKAVQSVFSQCLEGLDRPNLSMRTTLTAGVVNIVGNLVLVPLLGIAGAAVATAVSYGVGVQMNTIFLNRYIKIRVPVFELLWCTGAAIIMTAILWVVTQDFQPTSLIELGGIVAFGGAIYFAVVLSSQQIRMKIISNFKRAVL